MADENKKPETMMEALESASARIDKTIVESFRYVSGNEPVASIGLSVRRFHFAFVRSLQECTSRELFAPALGIIAKCLLPHLTDEEKEALSNEKLTGLL